MPFNGQGVFQRAYSWIQDAADATGIQPNRLQADAEDLAAGLSLAITRDGQGIPTADIPFGNHGITGMRPALASGEAVEFSQLRPVNLLHNGGFGVNQRGVGGTVTLAAGAYGHDRWKAGQGGCTYTFSGSGADFQVNITAGTLLQVVAGNDVQALKHTLSNLGTAQGRVYQGSVAGAPALAACPVTTAVLAAASPVIVEFGTGTLFLPQLETGTAPHAFARRPLVMETILCQAFFEAVPILWQGPVVVDGRTQGVFLAVPFKVNKVAIPTCTISVLVQTNETGSTTTWTAANNNDTFHFQNVTTAGAALQSLNNGGTFNRFVGAIAVSCDL